jgi:xylulose-5-phosphate/fructose-6-phosphate phosphoketolase
MPSNFHEVPNPPPEKSQLPDYLLKLAVNLDEKKKSILSQDELAAVKAYRRAANYIAAAMIFLKSNTLCERKVEHSDIKPRLLGHWGTCIPPISRSADHGFRSRINVGIRACQSIDQAAQN